MNAIQKADEEVFDKANADFSALHPEYDEQRNTAKEEYKKIIVAHIIGLQNEIGYANFPQYQILQKLLKIIKEV